ncbi:divalent cation transporter [Halarcobacter mediterraneus]|uniref:Divalent cation transporter n=1 Tax=Halarcobacter mediterraneus TaxID=2023153 RepID=A0A4Q1AYN6_9BACT|nr:ZIP family metal transporter [Halarcobacter mediterraneus]RXK14100.1 divalent cation transporter [Halarcobacter mediterraneus]
MLIKVIIFSFLAGITVFIGGVFSYYFEKTIHNRKIKITTIRFLTAFATGIMLAAVSFVLVPKGMHELSAISSISIFLLGALIFYFLDDYIHKNSKNIPQVIAMLLDFIPESIALGALFVYDYKVGILLAIFIAFQNLPESFGSYIELRASAFSKKKSLIILFLFSFIGVFFSLLGYFFLKDSPVLTSSLMLFAAGGILYLIFEDIAPSMKLKNSRFIAFGVNLGFIVGMLAEVLIS